MFNASGGTAAPEEPPSQIATIRGVDLGRGFNVNAVTEELARNGDGLYSVGVEELDRIELNLRATAGYLVVGGERRQLPIGSSLKAGVFRWQPGPGFLGEYNLEFEGPNAEFPRVRVIVHPKDYSGPMSRN